MSLNEYSRQTKNDIDFKFSLLDMILKILFNQYILNVRYSAKRLEKSNDRKESLKIRGKVGNITYITGPRVNSLTEHGLQCSI